MMAEKTCAACGRKIAWRKAWEKDWDAVRYCSAACRKTKPGAVGKRLEEAILQLLLERPRSSTICPSEAARQVFPEDWREHMEDTRRAARRLVAEQKIVITQGGVSVDASTAKGPIRLRLQS